MRKRNATSGHKSTNEVLLPKEIDSVLGEVI